MTKKLFLYFLILGIWYCNGHAQHVQEIKILHEDPSSITIEYTPVIKTSAYRGIDGVSYVTFKYRNVQSACSDTAGYVETYRVVPLFLPTNRCHVQIISAEAGITKELHALPVHALKKEDRLSLSHFDAVPYAEHPRAEVNAINRTSVGWVGSLKLLPVEIIDANHVKFYSKIVVQLRYAGVVGSHASALSLLSGKMPQISMSNRNTLSTKVVSSTSVAAPLSTGTWYQIAVNETGMYKLDYNFFVNSGVSAAELSNIHNLRLYGNGGKVLPVDLAAARPDSLLEIARLVVDQNGDSVFNQGDYIIFYGKSVRGWDYDAAGKTFHHYLNPYSETNYYFFTFTNGTGKDMNVEPSIISANAYQPTDFLDKVFDEQELHNIIPSGRRWLGKAYNILDNSGTYTKTLFGIVPNSSVLYRFLFLDRSLTNDQFSVSETGTTLVTWILPSMSSVDLSGPYSNVNEYAEETPVITATKNWNLSGETSSLNVSYTAGNSSAIGWIDWLEILYHRQFKAVNDSLLFTSPDTNASIVYSISNLSSSASTKVFDVSDHFNVQQISQVDVSVASTVKFGLTQTSGNVSSFAVIGPNGYKTISAPAVQVENTTLHASTNAYDFLIISPKDFLAQADRLRDYRIAHDTLRTLVVDINNIYHEFSSGIPDVMAIRNFLRYTLTNWSSAPHYILLFGWGHYDYKNITTSLPNWIPVFETQESIVQINSYASDDSLVILNAGDSRLSMSISRLPARTLQDATTMVDKIISYETASPHDLWRNRITFVGDDGKTTSSDDGDQYTQAMDDLASTYTPNNFEKQKIYSIVYPTATTGAGRRKPAVNAAIDQAINDGTLIINYDGHGSPQLWSYESIFTQTEDLPLLTNKNRLTFVMTATCDYAHYDNPTDLSAGEQLLTMDQGGAAGVFSSTRAVYYGDNEALNQSFYSYLFPGDSVYQQTPRLGDILWSAKQETTDPDPTSQRYINNMKYTLFADPTMRLVAPQGKLQIDSIDGTAALNVVSVKSLAVPRVSGTVKQADGSIDTALIQMFGPKQTIAVTDADSLWVGFSFVKDGPILYQGEIPVVNGKFSGMIPIPKDVSFGNQARISVYGWGSQSDVIGFTDSVKISGVDTTVAVDTVGPAMTIALDGAQAYDGMEVQPNATLQIKLDDSSGINSASLGIGHNITATLTNPDAIVNLSTYYRSDLGTYKHGTVTYEFNNLTEGRHELTVKAWDIQNNSSEKAIYFEVHAPDDAGIYQVYNFPNPFSRETNFTFQRNSNSPIDVDIRIYSIAGRLIETLSIPNVTDRFVKIPWNGRDKDGSAIANGVYLYKLIVHTQDRKNSNEIIGKLAVIR